jgi:type II secretory ATPase GspE/PulE/Tfp pilus assembly ATPase PilB-like protein
MTDNALLASTGLTLAQAYVLVSWWKPLVMLIVFLPWAWIVSSIYDKHAAQFFLPRRQWNIGHMCAGLVAVLAGLLVGAAMPGSEGAFWAGLGVMFVILLADLLAYMIIANKDERVPEKFKIRLNMAKLSGADKKAAKAAAKVQAKVALNIKGPDDKGKFTKLVTAPAAETPEYEVRTAAETIFISAQKARASQFEIGPTGKDNLYGVSLMVDGVRQAGETMPAANAARIMDFWKSAAGLDVNDRRRRQQAMLSAEEGVLKTIARVTSIGAQGGMKVTVLLNPEQQVTKKIEDLGLLEPQMKELRDLVADGKGVVLVTSPLDGGRTTSLYSIVKMHDAYTSNVQTVEMDPQAAIEGVRTNKFDPQGEAAPAAPGAPTGAPGGEFSTLVRSILRRDPDVVAVAELPDPQTAKEVAKADQERTRTYLSFKASDALSSIQAYVKAVGDPRQAAESLHGVVNQRLVRRLCSNCRQPYPPSPDMLKKLGVPEGRVQQLYKKGGQVLIKNKPEICPTCGGGGYFGQDGIFELYSLIKEDRDLIAQGNYQGLKAALRKKNLPTLQQVAIRKAVDGVTSVEEVMRVTAGEGAAPTPPATPPAAAAT